MIFVFFVHLLKTFQNKLLNSINLVFTALSFEIYEALIASKGQLKARMAAQRQRDRKIAVTFIGFIQSCSRKLTRTAKCCRYIAFAVD